MLIVPDQGNEDPVWEEHPYFEQPMFQNNFWLNLKDMFGPGPYFLGLAPSVELPRHWCQMFAQVPTA